MRIKYEEKIVINYLMNCYDLKYYEGSIKTSQHSSSHTLQIDVWNNVISIDNLGVGVLSSWRDNIGVGSNIQKYSIYIISTWRQVHTLCKTQSIIEVPHNIFFKCLFMNGYTQICSM